MNLSDLIIRRDSIKKNIDLIANDSSLQERFDLTLLQSSYDKVCKEIEAIIKENYSYKLQLAKEKYNSIINALHPIWHDWAKSLYTIDESFIVISHAREWNEPKQWACNDELDAVEKVNQLIQYKIYDRFRDRGSVDKDLGIIS